MNTAIRSVVIIGSGNVAHHLGRALTAVGVSIDGVVSRNERTGKSLAKDLDTEYSSNTSSIPDGVAVLLCVPDDSIHDILENVSASNPVAYTSGSVDIKTLPQREKLGVFYPLQSFSMDSGLQYDKIPFFIEANSTEFESELFELANKISKNVKIADSEYRKNLHLAAVWVNNFTNHILHNAMNICKERNVDFDALLPLLEETVNKISHQTPFEAQTGPARRNDKIIIQEHLESLDGDQKEIYRIITQSISNTYHND